MLNFSFSEPFNWYVKQICQVISGVYSISFSHGQNNFNSPETLSWKIGKKAIKLFKLYVKNWVTFHHFFHLSYSKVLLKSVLLFSKNVALGKLMMMMNCFCGMVDRRKAFSLISSRDHCQRSSPSRISDTPRAGYEPVQNLSSGLVEWFCAVVITTTPQRHIHSQKRIASVNKQINKELNQCKTTNIL